MHLNVIKFISEIKEKFSKYFINVDVLDCGSFDINGNNRSFFTDSRYIGIDIMKGKNVDIVTKVHEFIPNKQFDTVLSSEMLEHDSMYWKSLERMFELTKSNGLLLLTAAGKDREEHGTFTKSPKDSPMTNNYYRNVSVEMLQQGLNFSKFSWFVISYEDKDIRFAGIKA